MYIYIYTYIINIYIIYTYIHESPSVWRITTRNHQNVVSTMFFDQKIVECVMIGCLECLCLVRIIENHDPVLLQGFDLNTGLVYWQFCTHHPL